ncbi:hypothetical protein [Peribacillus sp. SCS-155]|uniref:hypothetical protein n=1 Tax=Peribacillus sedimenti TaxID=3115297 RepID=UPI00390687BA
MVKMNNKILLITPVPGIGWQIHRTKMEIKGRNELQQPFHHIARGIIIGEQKCWNKIIGNFSYEIAIVGKEAPSISGRLLVQGRGQSNSFLPGGNVEFGESAKKALAKESKEE